MREEGAGGREAVDVGGRGPRVSVGAQVIRPQCVDQDQDQVWRRRRRRRFAGEEHEAAKPAEEQPTTSETNQVPIRSSFHVQSLAALAAGTSTGC